MPEQLDWLIPTVLILLGVCLLIVLVAYVVIKARSRKTIVISEVCPGGQVVAADHFYYLPVASLSVKGYATVTILRDRDTGIIENAFLSGLRFESTVHIEPDTSRLIGITYKPDAFSEDEIQITTTETGLLQNVSVVSEDRVSSIVAQIAQAPDQFANKQLHEVAAKQQATISQKAERVFQVETREFERSFVVSSGEVQGAGFERDWRIPVDGIQNDLQVVNASFRFSRKGISKKVELSGSYDGLLTRPLTMVNWDLSDNSPLTGVKAAFQSTLSCLIPDESMAVNVPVRRYLFVKHKELPKFSNGILVEKYVSHGSEVEGFISIPINILKAIVSIPSWLFQFRITRINQEVALEKARQSVITDRKKAVTKPEAGKPPTENPELPRKAQFGKLPADETVEAHGLHELMEKTFDAKVAAVAEAGIAATDFCNWHEKYTGVWKEYDNYRIKSCVPAAAAHLITCWSANTKSVPRVLSDQEVLQAYKAVSGYDGNSNDVGCKLEDFLIYWDDNGFGGESFVRRLFIKKKIASVLEYGVYWFGGAMVGLQMPSHVEAQAKWEVPPANLKDKDIKLHCVAVLGCVSNYFIAISCGRKVSMSYAFYELYNDESVVVLSNVWLKADGQSPSNESLALLTKRLKQMNVV
ncbi:hypothetical protein [Filimonas effusa]|uniref:Uncharacterized protein n=1 Tax=Filimonas effusa TaxID=2508721 RepID=A0A4Q1DBD7_9BACT|nr:hypothetical protein [Filimonas effusa]RXK86747.1 hypothetical protein ESB13_08080 [Filimonas effusa]